MVYLGTEEREGKVDMAALPLAVTYGDMFINTYHDLRQIQA